MEHVKREQMLWSKKQGTSAEDTLVLESGHHWPLGWGVSLSANPDWEPLAVKVKHSLDSWCPVASLSNMKGSLGTRVKDTEGTGTDLEGTTVV